jgi:hypothetical protein
MVEMVHDVDRRMLEKVKAERVSNPEPEVTVALYRPSPSKDQELRELIAMHLPTLKRLGLITDRPSLLMKSKNGTYIEIFEWSTGGSAYQAEQHPEVAKIWEAMARIAELPALNSLEEASMGFPQFKPVHL